MIDDYTAFVSTDQVKFLVFKSTDIEMLEIGAVTISPMMTLV